MTKAAYINFDIDEAYVSQHIALVRLVEPTLAKYLHFWTISPANGRSQLLADAYGNGKPGLNLDNIRTMVVALPPVPEQVALVAKIDETLQMTDLLGHDAKAAKNDLDQLDQSILAKAFCGELVPQDPNEEPASALLVRIREQRSQQVKAAKGKKNAKMQRRDEMGKRSSALSSQHRPLVAVLTAKGQPIPPERLLTEAGYDDGSIEDFYLALREEIAKGCIQENRPTESDVVLEAVKQ